MTWNRCVAAWLKCNGDVLPFGKMCCLCVAYFLKSVAYVLPIFLKVLPIELKLTFCIRVLVELQDAEIKARKILSGRTRFPIGVDVVSTATDDF